MWTRRFPENVNIWCLVLALRLNLSQAVACQSKCQEIRIFMSLINCNRGWADWLPLSSPDAILRSDWLGRPSGVLCQAEDCEAQSDLTLGILLKYPFCFDLSFDWNCPEKIACDQNMPHQFLSNHWRYFDREDCFLTKPINLQTRKQQRRIISVINLHLISANPKKLFHWESGRLNPNNRHTV